MLLDKGHDFWGRCRLAFLPWTLLLVSLFLNWLDWLWGNQQGDCWLVYSGSVVWYVLERFEVTVSVEMLGHCRLVA